MLAFFGESQQPEHRFLAADAVPEPYRDLLVHHGHMTETLERHYQCPVRVHPYVIHRQGDIYGRKLDLTADVSGEIVMTGIMIFNLNVVKDEVRQEILQGVIPLGRILVSHGVLREVNASAFLELAPNDPFSTRFQMTTPVPAYGRLATITCDGAPAVDLLEIVRPQVPTSST